MSKNSLRFDRGAPILRKVYASHDGQGSDSEDRCVVAWKIDETDPLCSPPLLPPFRLSAKEQALANDEALRLHRLFVKRTNPYGGNGSLRPASLQRAFEFLGLNNESVFCDMGCGPGNVLLAALLTRNVRRAIGIEFNRDVCMLGDSIYTETWRAHRLPGETANSARFQISESDLRFTQTVPNDITHVYSYDLVMNRKALRNIARLMNVVKPTVFLSFKTASFWRRCHLHATCVGSVGGLVTTGGQHFTCYKFERFEERPDTDTSGSSDTEDIYTTLSSSGSMSQVSDSCNSYDAQQRFVRPRFEYSSGDELLLVSAESSSEPHDATADAIASAMFGYDAATASSDDDEDKKQKK